MIHEKQEYEHLTNNILGVVAGALIGALAGALTMLLLAPQSGKDTRRQLQEKGIELRERTTELVEDTVAQARMNANKITAGIKNYGQELAVEQLDHVSKAARAGKKAIQSS